MKGVGCSFKIINEDRGSTEGITIFKIYRIVKIWSEDRNPTRFSCLHLLRVPDQRRKILPGICLRAMLAKPISL